MAASAKTLFQESVDAIALDAAGAVYVTGYTTAADLPVTAGALDTTCGSDGACNGGFSDAFVAKLSPDGRQLVYLTYLGGSDGDWGTGIAVDETGAAYVSGITQSLDFSAGELWGKEGPPDYTQLRRGFVAKLSPDGSQLTYQRAIRPTGDGDLRYRRGRHRVGVSHRQLRRCGLPRHIGFGRGRLPTQDLRRQAEPGR